MEWNLRTVVRVFLIAGGIGYVVWGAVTGRTLWIALGVAAAVIGVVGLWLGPT